MTSSSFMHAPFSIDDHAIRKKDFAWLNYVAHGSIQKLQTDGTSLKHHSGATTILQNVKRYIVPDLMTN